MANLKNTKSKKGGSGFFLVIIFIYFGGFTFLENAANKIYSYSNAIVYGTHYQVQASDINENYQMEVFFEDEQGQTTSIITSPLDSNLFSLVESYGPTTMFYESSSSDLFLLNDFYLSDLGISFLKLLISIFIFYSILKSVLRLVSPRAVAVLDFIHSKVICLAIYSLIFVLCLFLHNSLGIAQEEGYGVILKIIMAITALSVLAKIFNIIKLASFKGNTRSLSMKKVTSTFSPKKQTPSAKSESVAQSENLGDLITRKPTRFKHQTSREQ